MQMLEQKKVRTPKTAAPALKTKVPSPKNSSPGKIVDNAASAESATITNKATSGSEKPIVKNTDSNSPKPKAKLNQPSKESRLKAFENSFIKIG